jgi:DNA-binding NarL/FixJ family response regulator
VSYEEIKVLLAQNPQMLRGLVGDLIQSQADMEVVGEVLNPIEILLTVKTTKADVVIITLLNSEEEPGIISHLLAEYPNLLIIAISSTRNLAYTYRKTVSKEKLFNISKEDILAAIRTVKEDQAP